MSYRDARLRDLSLFYYRLYLDAEPRGPMAADARTRVERAPDRMAPTKVR
ncbi:MAG TPA: hypothetical protein VML75_21005 [Kofleriaceae bacterium]|nr:hypothetical protein [Kofleriaceae bacterium]